MEGAARLWPEGALLVIAAASLIYGLAAVGAVFAARALRSLLVQSRSQDPLLRRAARLMQSYFRGPRAGLSALAGGLYCLAGVWLLMREGAALWVFAAAAVLDAGLFLLWRERAGFLARLTRAERLCEAGASAVVLACLFGLSQMHFSGVLR